LKRGVPAILDGNDAPTAMVIEGGGNLATVWEKEADRRGIARYRISAEEWRQRFLYSREQRSGPEAKHHAGEIARKIIEWSGTDRPTSLRHDAAEAIMIGLWGVVHLDWLPALPRELQR
jgi:hypothetical protein